MLFIYYPKCSTCQKAKNHLDEKNLKYIARDIKLSNPTKEEIASWINKYNLDVNKLFNTSGLVYKDLNLKEKMSILTKEEKINLLSSNGMLIKRPLLIGEDFIYIGYKVEQYNNIK